MAYGGEGISKRNLMKLVSQLKEFAKIPVLRDSLARSGLRVVFSDDIRYNCLPKGGADAVKSALISMGYGSLDGMVWLRPDLLDGCKLRSIRFNYNGWKELEKNEVADIEDYIDVGSEDIYGDPGDGIAAYRGATMVDRGGKLNPNFVAGAIAWDEVAGCSPDYGSYSILIDPQVFWYVLLEAGFLDTYAGYDDGDVFVSVRPRMSSLSPKLLREFSPYALYGVGYRWNRPSEVLQLTSVMPKLYKALSELENVSGSILVHGLMVGGLFAYVVTGEKGTFQMSYTVTPELQEVSEKLVTAVSAISSVVSDVYILLNDDGSLSCGKYLIRKTDNGEEIVTIY